MAVRTLFFSLLFTLVVSLIDQDFNEVVRSHHTHTMRQDQCGLTLDQRQDCHPEPHASRSSCESRGCCWSPPLSRSRGLPWCFYPKGQCTMVNIKRIDCHPGPGASQQACLARKCCWRPAQNGLPWCYYPNDPQTGYTASSANDTATGFTSTLTIKKASHWPRNIQHLKFDVMMETENRLHLKITDRDHKRWEVPLKTPKVHKKSNNTQYVISYSKDPFSITISRRSTGEILFDTRFTNLVYSDQFIELSTKLPSKFLYGLGEHRGPLLKNVKDGQKLSFWARDIPPRENFNLYGVHPFYVAMGRDGTAHGVFLLNSNAMDVILAPDQTLTYRTIGGVLDFYLFTGPTPDDVIKQYSEVVGRPAMPPFWSLGFHLCRWGYGNTANMKRIVDRMMAADLPYDVQWNDIDYMRNKYDFTVDKTNFRELPELVDNLHKLGKRYVMIVDAGIPNKKGYKAFDDGMAMDVFVKKADGSGPIIGKVWPGTTAFPDFSHPNASEFWYQQFKFLHQNLKFDGAWIDMDEPSNFFTGSEEGCPGNSPLDNPPYLPGYDLLMSKTLCPSAKHYLGPHYDLHSLYGFQELIATNKALKRIFPGKRPFIVTRSSFSGAGHFGFHWLGDNNADYANLKYSIAGIINNNMYGFSMVGADICGFMGTTNEDLCIRWMQLGAFYPFMRNHNTLGAPDQDPANPAFSSFGRRAMKFALQLRYALLPHLYTLLYRSHTTGVPVVRPLSFQYPLNVDTYGIDEQFMWGDSLLISPVLRERATQVRAYFPKDVWYDGFTGARLNLYGYVVLHAPIGSINFHIRGGAIVPLQQFANSTVFSRKTPFLLYAALPALGKQAKGELFWDDGESESADGKLTGNLLKFEAEQTSPAVGGMTVKHANAMPYKVPMKLAMVRVMGVPDRPKNVTVNGRVTSFSFDNGVLDIHIKLIDMYSTELTIAWSSQMFSPNSTSEV